MSDSQMMTATTKSRKLLKATNTTIALSIIALVTCTHASASDNKVSTNTATTSPDTSTATKTKQPLPNKIDNETLDRILQLSTDFIKEQPENALAYRSRGYLLQHEKGDFAGAYEAYSNSIKHDPLNVRTYVDRARVLQKLNRHAEALVDFARALELNSKDYRWVHAERAQSFYELGRTTEAWWDVLTATEAGLEISPDFKAKLRHSQQQPTQWPKFYDPAPATPEPPADISIETLDEACEEADKGMTTEEINALADRCEAALAAYDAREAYLEELKKIECEADPNCEWLNTKANAPINMAATLEGRNISITGWTTWIFEGARSEFWKRIDAIEDEVNTIDRDRKKQRTYTPQQ